MKNMVEYSWGLFDGTLCRFPPKDKPLSNDYVTGLIKGSCSYITEELDYKVLLDLYRFLPDGLWTDDRGVYMRNPPLCNNSDFCSSVWSSNSPILKSEYWINGKVFYRYTL